MPTEIERKFLVTDGAWRTQAHRRELYRQGYLASGAHCSVRVRIGGERAWLGLKGRVRGASRLEYEYSIPVAEANEILDQLCEHGLVEKVRHWVRWAAHEWEVDEFLGANAGLVMAEVELEREDEPVELPPWAGLEVTHDVRYYNSSLARQPYGSWTQRREVSA